MSMTHTDRAIGLNSIGGSGTTYEERNPSFAVVEFDALTMLPINMKTYYFDLVTANTIAGDTPGWTFLHDWKETYGLKDLSPASMLDLSERFKTDQDLAITYNWNRNRQYGTRPTSANGVDTFCYTSTSEMYQHTNCLNQHSTQNGINFKGLSGQIIADWLIGNWITIRD